VQPGFKLETFDYVHNPSNYGAYPLHEARARALREAAGAGAGAGRVEQPSEGSRMNLIERYAQLERSVAELLSLKGRDVPPNMRKIVERQSFETLRELGKLVEDAGPDRALFSGLLAQLTAHRSRNFVSMAESDAGPDAS